MVATILKKAGNLLDQYQLLRSVIDAPWAKRLDHKVASHVIDRLRKDVGNSRASLRYLERATGSSRTRISSSLKKLCNKSIISVAREGKGTRPTEFAIHFLKTPSGDKIVPASGIHPSGDHSATTEGTIPTPLDSLCGDESATESYLRSPLTSGLTEVESNTPAPASPPPLAALTRATADGAAESHNIKSGFEELWALWPKKKKRKDARAAYDSISPDSEMHQQMLGAAKQWATSYEAHGTEDKWRKHLHKWLSDECFHEDPPVAYEPFKAKTRKSKASPACQGPMGEHIVEIVGSDVTKDREGITSLKFDFKIQEGPLTGETFSHQFRYHDERHEIDELGSRLFADIRKATKKEDLQGTGELHGLKLITTVDKNGSIQFSSFG